jgi:hypothetical protein
MTRRDGFIPGVFNYCDRWCERCHLTARCSLFALNRDVEARVARGEDAAEAFWEALQAIYDQRVGAADTNQGGPFDADDEQEASDEDTLECDRGVPPAFGGAPVFEPECRPLVLDAQSYADAARQWRDQYAALATGRADATTAGIAVNDALEVIGWYRIQIITKLGRATVSDPWEDEGETDARIEAAAGGEAEYEDLPSDADGSAKVALLGIERSFAAWSVLRDAVPDAAEATLALMRRLMRLRLAVERRFPAARAFKRPGFDD